MKKFILILTCLVGAAYFLVYPFFIRAHIMQAFRIPSGAMMPTLLSGDHILVDKTISGEEVRKGDLIVFRFPKDPNKSFLKRVIGLPGDTIEIRKKQLIINGEEIEENYIIHEDDKNDMDDRDNFGPLTIPSKSLFVLGDNRDKSFDSRFFGVLSYDDLIGRVKLIYWSWDKEAKSARWNRIGKYVK